MQTTHQYNEDGLIVLPTDLTSAESILTEHPEWKDLQINNALEWNYLLEGPTGEYTIFLSPADFDNEATRPPGQAPWCEYIFMRINVPDHPKSALSLGLSIADGWHCDEIAQCTNGGPQDPGQTDQNTSWFRFYYD